MMQGGLSAALFRPPRLNFAQVCSWCGVRFCMSGACEATHELFWFAVCSECDGDPEMVGCGCTLGVVEVSGREEAERLAHRFAGDYRRSLPAVVSDLAAVLSPPAAVRAVA